MSFQNTKFIWIRHAPVKAIMPGRIYGQRDVGCNLKNTERLLALADQLPEDAVWVSSSLSRTKKTAKAIGEQKGWKIRPLAYKELMEQNFGLWQSKTWDELEDEPESKDFWDDPAGMCPPDGESFTDLCGRVEKCINHLAKKYKGQTLVCVTHAGTIRAAIAQALDMTPTSALKLKIDTLSISEITQVEDSWVVERINN